MLRMQVIITEEYCGWKHKYKRCQFKEQQQLHVPYLGGNIMTLFEGYAGMYDKKKRGFMWKAFDEREEVFDPSPQPRYILFNNIPILVKCKSFIVEQKGSYKSDAPNCVGGMIKRVDQMSNLTCSTTHKPENWHRKDARCEIRATDGKMICFRFDQIDNHMLRCGFKFWVE